MSIGFTALLASAGETLRFVALNSFRIWHSHYFMFYAATLLDSFGNPIELAPAFLCFKQAAHFTSVRV